MSQIENDPTKDRDFSFEVNLAGVAAATGRGNLKVPTGFYKVNVVDAFVKPEAANRIIMAYTFADGDYAGVRKIAGQPVPTSAEDKSRHYWRAMLESLGYEPKDLDSGAVQVGRAALVDRVAFIKYTAEEDTGTGYDRTEFLAPANWEQQRNIFANTSPPSPVAAAPAKTAPAIPQAAPRALGSAGASGGNTTQKSELLKNMLAR